MKRTWVEAALTDSERGLLKRIYDNYQKTGEWRKIKLGGTWDRETQDGTGGAYSVMVQAGFRHTGRHFEPVRVQADVLSQHVSLIIQ